MSVLLLVFTDGRDELLDVTLESAETLLDGNITRAVIHTDKSSTHVNELSRRYPDYEICGGTRVGFGGAINRAWGMVKDFEEEHVFHLEDDFIFNRKIDLRAMESVLNHQPKLIQLALRRQPWNEAERQAGGIVEMWPNEYTSVFWDGRAWLEHRLFFTTNPSMYRRRLCYTGWPTCDRSERVFSDALFSDKNLVCGFWGSRDSGEWVRHIGADRVGIGY